MAHQRRKAGASWIGLVEERLEPARRPWEVELHGP